MPEMATIMTATGFGSNSPKAVAAVSEEQGASLGEGGEDLQPAGQSLLGRRAIHLILRSTSIESFTDHNTE